MIDLFSGRDVIHSSPITSVRARGASQERALSGDANPANPGTTIQYTLTERGQYR